MGQAQRRAFLYTRVSTAMQEEDGVSLDAQQAMAEAWCAARGVHLVETFTDVMSGGSASRPSLERLREALLAKRADMVLVYKVDRLSRNTGDYMALLREFEERGVGLASLTQDIDATSTMGRFVLRLLINVAEMESDQTADRMRDSIRFRVAKGRLLGGPQPPLGYRRTKEDGQSAWVVDEGEAATVRRAFAALLQAGTVLGTIALLKAEGLHPRSGRWTAYGLTGLLKNPNYRGASAYCKRRTVRGADGRKRTERVPPEHWVLVEGAVPAIVPEGLWHQVQAQLETMRPAPGQKGPNAKHAWTGLLRCGACGCSLGRSAGKSGRDRSGTLWAWRCTAISTYGPGHCAKPARLAEAYLEEAIFPRMLVALAQSTSLKLKAPPKAARQAKTSTEAKLAQLEGRRERVRGMFEMGDLAAPAYRARMDAIKEEEAAILAEGQKPTPSAPAPAHDAVEALARLEGLDRRAVLKALVKALVVGDHEVEVQWAGQGPGWPGPLAVPVYSLSTREGKRAAGRT